MKDICRTGIDRERWSRKGDCKLLRTEKGDEVVRRISKVETASTDTHYSMNGVKGGKTYL
jgi:hypothetical protein